MPHIYKAMTIFQKKSDFRKMEMRFSFEWDHFHFRSIVELMQNMFVFAARMKYFLQTQQ